MFPIWNLRMMIHRSPGSGSGLRPPRSPWTGVEVESGAESRPGDQLQQTDQDQAGLEVGEHVQDLDGRLRTHGDETEDGIGKRCGEKWIS
ncbi:hypothetical protein WMY93_033753, partial [Mugilogobius chulae]